MGKDLCENIMFYPLKIGALQFKETGDANRCFGRPGLGSLIFS